MAQKKLIRFAEIKSFPNVLEYPENMKGNWNKFFRNANLITLELACGKGEYAVGLGKIHINKNFIGVDVKGNRIWRGAKNALAESLTNIAFLRTQIDKITDYFAPNEVHEIWLTFPDPQLRASKAKKRLTHPKFLRLYQQILQPNGIIHLKTDSPNLYNFTKKVIKVFNLELLIDLDDVYAAKNILPELQIQTHYEKLDIAQSHKIFYLQFKINQPLPIEKDELLKEEQHNLKDN